MIPMKILFIICVLCSFKLSQSPAPPPGIRGMLRSLSLQAMQKLMPKKEIQELETARSIEVHEVKPIDLTSLTPDTFEYRKNVVLLFCEILDYKFFNGTHPKDISLKDLENQETDDGPLEVTHEGKPEKDTTSPSSLPQDKLILITQELLTTYHVKIDPRGYTEKAFYFVALQWLKHNMAYSETLSASIKKITDHKFKARNYLYEFINPDELNKFYDFSDNKWKTLQGWKEEDKYSVSLAFIEDIYISKGEVVKYIEIKCKDIETYEKILNRADQKLFYEVMHMDVWTAIRALDNSFKIKGKTDTSIPPPYKRALATNDIDLAKSSMPRGSVRYYKHVAILFVEALNKKLSSNVLSDENFSNLVEFPERDDPTNVLRYCEFQNWFGQIIPQMKPKFENVKKEDYPFRSHIFRIFDWFILQLESDNPNAETNCKYIQDSLAVFMAEQAIAHPMETLLKKENNKPICFPESRSANTFNELMKLGEKEDLALNTFILITSWQLEEDLKTLMEKSANERHKLNFHDSMTLNYRIKYLRTALTNIKQYGTLLSTVQCESIDYYQTIIDRMDEEQFSKFFYRKPQDMKSALEKELDNRCKQKIESMEIHLENMETKPLDPSLTSVPIDFTNESLTSGTE